MSELKNTPGLPPPPSWTESGDLEGWVHATENCSSTAGPGMRYVLTLSGCPLRCQYCDAPDTWERHEGAPALVADVLADIARRKTLLRGRGGVTLGGGEPLLQSKFCRAILEGCKAMGLHTALDTAGYYGDYADDALLASVDLVLLDIKTFSAERQRTLSGGELEPVLRFANVLAALNKAVWLRFVLVPGLTDDFAEIAALARYAAGLGNVERVDVVPFEQHGGYKWRDRGLEYPLAGVAPPTEEALAKARDLFRAEGLQVY
ncbi:pyruvate formate-lyase-activating protein [Azonexus sp. IMCC34842]|uniref:pyruvate formate-lyase-activating protein n=1 Tax=Azonexaceae TaxID=2008795 RepID=UPI001CF89B2F|nr:pyruvate formate-lyase-activating protein [Dechloromonas denitrificans]UCV05559.1 pyruvate formate lyase-activating protein [Dechloromonas denitrificans]